MMPFSIRNKNLQHKYRHRLQKELDQTNRKKAVIFLCLSSTAHVGLISTRTPSLSSHLPSKSFGVLVLPISTSSRQKISLICNLQMQLLLKHTRNLEAAFSVEERLIVPISSYNKAIKNEQTHAFKYNA